MQTGMGDRIVSIQSMGTSEAIACAGVRVWRPVCRAASSWLKSPGWRILAPAVGGGNERWDQKDTDDSDGGMMVLIKARKYEILCKNIPGKSRGRNR